MHGVIVQVKIDPSREDEARRLLREAVVPRAKQLAGFVGGNWLRALDGDRGTSVLLFESEEAARAAAERIRSEARPRARLSSWRPSTPTRSSSRRSPQLRGVRQMGDSVVRWRSVRSDARRVG